MKQILSLFLLLSILIPSVVNVGVSVYYHLNKAYITQQLCENRSKPGMHCNGKCFLSKQLKKAEQREEKQTQNLKEKEEQNLTTEDVWSTQYIPVLRFVSFVIPDKMMMLSSFTVSSEIPPEQLS